MKTHRYRITVEPLASPTAGSPDDAPLVFEASSHDDILALVGKVGKQDAFTPDTARAFVVGLKLFGEVLLENRDTPFFAPLLQQFKEMMKTIKQRQT
jgi:hypothetical protein